LLSGKTFLVTGATGRLGCEIVRRLEEFGATVLPLILYGYPDKPKRVKWTGRSVPIVVKNIQELNSLPTPDFVINLHWRVNRSLPFTRQLVYEIRNNIHRIAFLWNWLVDKQVQRFINISSTHVFSYLNQNPISANAEPLPVSPYGMAKVTAERFFDAHFHNCSFRVTHLRLCSVASFGEHPSQLMSQLYMSAFENRRIRINTGHIGYIIYIDEAADIIINAALRADQWRYIITPPGKQNDRTALKFQSISRQKLRADYIDFTSGTPDLIFVSDIKKLRSDWTRVTPLESMIKKILYLYRQRSDVSQ
jgi:nucleoside-diphosphate-sugar epimerase